MLNEEFDLAFVLVDRLRAENNDLRRQLAAQAKALFDRLEVAEAVITRARRIWEAWELSKLPFLISGLGRKLDAYDEAKEASDVE